MGVLSKEKTQTSKSYGVAPDPVMSAIACLQQSLATCARLASEMANTWDDYRKRRNLAWFAFLSYVPVMFVVGMLSMRLFSTFTPAFVVGIAGMVFYVIAGNRAMRFACPRCGKWFFAK